MSAKRNTAKQEPEAIESHELAGELTHEQRIRLAEGLAADNVIGKIYFCN